LPNILDELKRLLDLDGDALEIQYRHTLENLAKAGAILGTIFRKSQNKIRTGGFFLAAHDYISHNYKLDKVEKKFLKENTFKGWEIVDGAARLCVMNLYLHGINGEDSPVVVGDSLIADPGERFDMVLTNPPFGKKMF
jgi:hypothetical protein